MKLVTIKQEFLDIFDFPTEIMHKDNNGKDRPFLIILALKYKGKKRTFALPFRSNIQVNKNTKGTYFPLPRRSTTKNKRAHGLHYIKMFPINKQYYNKFVVADNKYNKILMEHIDKNLFKIVQGAQQYLTDYENGIRYNFCTDIDRMIHTLEQYEAIKKIEKEAIEQIVAGKENS